MINNLMIVVSLFYNDFTFFLIFTIKKTKASEYYKKRMGVINLENYFYFNRYNSTYLLTTFTNLVILFKNRFS